VQYTGSTRGRWVLDNWNDLSGKFVKVMPTDYKLALKKLQEEAQAMQAGGVEVAHG
jgi:glutamate synthase domain-containing protein 3